MDHPGPFPSVHCVFSEFVEFFFSFSLLFLFFQNILNFFLFFDKFNAKKCRMKLKVLWECSSLETTPHMTYIDHRLHRNLFMASLWIGSGGPFLLYICKQGEGGICQKPMQYYGFISNSDVILHNGGGRGSKKRLEFCVNPILCVWSTNIWHGPTLPGAICKIGKHG